MQPLVSICLPTLNAREFLEPRMLCILSQTMGDWELIVCDSYSDDGTWEYFQEFRNDPRIRLYQVPKEGLYAGWNECLRRARGEYVYIATADDTMTHDCLGKMAAALDMLPIHGDSRPVDICVCDFDYIDEKNAILPRRLLFEPGDFYGEWMKVPHVRDGRTEFLVHACMGTPWITMTAVLFRRRLLDRVGVFNTGAGVFADQEWQMRACLASDIVFVPGKYATWRRYSGQASVRMRKSSISRADGVIGCLDRVMSDPRSGIPVEWQSVPGWRKRIMNVQATMYLDSYKLYLDAASRAPARFARNILQALRSEPAFLLHQMLHGFRWDPSLSPDPVAEARNLIDLFKSPWPPRRFRDLNRPI